MSDVQQHVIKNSDGSISIGTTQNVEDILKQNVFEANNNVNRSDHDTWGRKVASIPLNLINMWCKEWNITLYQLMNDPMYKAKMMARLNDRDYLKLRTDNGKI